MSIKITWVVNDVLAHSAYPSPQDLESISSKGIGAIVSLEKREDKDLILNRFEYLEEYVRDFSAPSFRQLDRINEFIDEMAGKNKPVLVHCLEAGRSGTAIVAYLIYKGMSFDDALHKVRRQIEDAVDCDKQVQTLRKYEKRIRGGRVGEIQTFRSKSYIQNPWYLQTDKIEALFNKSLSTYEKFLGKVGLMKIRVKTLLVEIELEGKNREDQTVYYKLQRIIEESEKENTLFNLNKAKLSDLRSNAYIYFDGKAIFELHSEDPEIITVRGKAGKKEFVCNCSKKYFAQLSASLFTTILDAGKFINNQSLDIFLIGKIMQSPRTSKEFLLLNALYIGGSTEDINSIYKTKS